MSPKSKYDLEKPTIDGKTIGKRIAFIRKQKGFTQAELAVAVGITQNLVSDYETESARISAFMLYYFAKALGVSSDEILGLTELKHEQFEPSLRIMRRMAEIKALPELKQKKILSTIDDLIRAAK